MVVRVRLAVGERRRRSQAVLLEQRNWAEVVANHAAVFDIPPGSVFMRSVELFRSAVASGSGVSGSGLPAYCQEPSRYTRN